VYIVQSYDITELSYMLYCTYSIVSKAASAFLQARKHRA
jgi:hypothetical protein